MSEDTTSFLRSLSLASLISCMLPTACCLLFLFSCAPKRVELPNYEGVDVRDVIAERNSIKSVEATFSVEMEKSDSIMTGEAALELTDETLDLRIYSLGFLVAEITEANGVIKSSPEFSRSRNIILVEGLRNSIFWWAMGSCEAAEQDGVYQMKNSRRKVLVDKKTMLPEYQAMELDDGRELRIFYEDPMKSGEFWYQSRMRIELSKYVVRIRIKSISFIPYSTRGQQ